MAQDWIHLNHLALLEFRGEDAASFLQGQLSSDIRQLKGDVCQLSTYSSPKGRMFASFLAYQSDAETIFLVVSRDLADFVLKRLSMFILRSKVKARLAEEFTLFGALNDETMQARLSWTQPHAPWRKYTQGDDVFLALPEQRWLGVTKAPADKMTGALADWLLADIAQGVPWITAASKDMFVPQMCHFELIGGGVNFQKGCYPGQEIVARSQYLGKVKRRMLPASVAHLDVAVGDALYTPSSGEQAIGHVLSVVPQQDHSQLLAVLQWEKIQDGVFLKAQPQALLQFASLPYAVPDFVAQ